MLQKEPLTALRPIRTTKQWLSVFLKDTSVTAGVSNAHSADHKTPEFEFGALNRLATTLLPMSFPSRLNKQRF